MTINTGDKLPAIKLTVMGKQGPEAITTDDIFGGKKVVLFALPGAYTPTCSAAHLPGYLASHDAIKAKGVDSIACLAVNDAYVMGAWGEAQNVGDKILMLADGNADFTRAIGLEIDRSASDMGMRSQRYAMIVEDGIVTHLNIEIAPQFEVSDAETILNLL
jgi:peroxiredoxin (alkyl hydroperoxide reductase subunit C)